MPLLGTMFDSVIKIFLTPWSTVKSGKDEQLDKGDEGTDVDEDKVLEDASPLIVKNTMKAADKREMDGFAKIFKHHGLTGMNDLSASNCASDAKIVLQLCGLVQWLLTQTRTG